MSNDDPTPGLRSRAYQLADTGRYSDWSEIAADMIAEEVPEVLVRRLGHDRLFQLMLKSRIEAGRGE